MGICTCLDVLLPYFVNPHLSFVPMRPRMLVPFRRNTQPHDYSSNKKRKTATSRGRTGLYCVLANAGKADPKETYSGDAFSPDSSGNSDSKIALEEAKPRQETVEKDQLIEEMATSEAKWLEYAAAIIEHDKDSAITELEAAKSLLVRKLRESVEEKLDSVQPELVVAKQDAIEFASQVERLVEIAFEHATSCILENARLRVVAVETSASEKAYHMEEEIRNAVEGTISSILDRSNNTIKKALNAADQASYHAKKAVSALSSGAYSVDELAAVQSENIELQNAISNLEAQLLVMKNDVERLKSELERSEAAAKALEFRASVAEGALFDLQELNQKTAKQRDNEIKSHLEKLKKDSLDREKASMKVFKSELDRVMDAVDAVKEIANLKDEAYSRRYTAFQRSLRAAEATSEVWRRRAEVAESILQSKKIDEEYEISYSVNGGRMNLTVDDDVQKWKLLAEGPRREIPDWVARRIKTILPEFPPIKTDISEALLTETLSLDLPSSDQVWSIADEKTMEADMLEQALEKEALEKKRKTLERTLHRKTIKWLRVPEKLKLEPGTGTGREIVFQGFNWESWRRRWYVELAQKAADLSQSGVTAVWFPPPTQSVSPQGYMPSDLYNLNSAYGTIEELKGCIEEMHRHELLALGDVVLNHRCAQKQSPNGVWNIFGGKLAWGPEAIVRDDPNFQGRGNPSTGEIFHAAPNIDHSQQFVRKDIKEWLNWLRTDIGFDGWRLDFVRGFSGAYVREYIEASNPSFAIGEYWDSLAYEGGNLCYNQDGHRQRIINWINATEGTSSAFDVTTKGILHSAMHNQYWRLIDPQGKPSGVMGWWPSRAVTFLENHDTGSTQGHWPFPRDKLPQGYAYILTHPGTPVIFFDHFYDFGLQDTITELIEARRRAGIHCRSSIKILHANGDGYVACVGETLVVKIGHFDWNPSKENNLEGTWQKFADKGSDYQVWLRL